MPNMGYSYTLEDVSRPLGPGSGCKRIEWFGSLRLGGEMNYFVSALPYKEVRSDSHCYGERVRRPVQLPRHVLWWLVHGKGWNRFRWICALLCMRVNRDLVFVED